GLVLRFVAEPGLWLDEAQSVVIARLPLDGGFFQALREDGAPPLYYLLLHFWMVPFGTGDFAVRALSGAFSVASLPLAWLAGRRVGGSRWFGGVALALTATNPWMLRYASETRMYSLLVLLVLTGLLVLDAVRRRPTVPRAIGIALVTGALMLTHYWSFFLLGVVGLGLLYYGFRHRARWTIYAIAGLAAGILLFLPWMP